MHLPLVVVLSCLILIVSPSLAQERPYPQNVKYPFGYMPTGLASTKVKTEYARWKKNHLRECDGGYLVLCQNGDTRVEGIGFGMLLTVYMADKEQFDGLYKFYSSKCNSSAGNMMVWRVNCESNLEQGSATDGDIDVAFALIIASWQWPNGNYQEEAKKVINNLRSKVVTTCSGNVMSLSPGYSGSAWGGCDYTDISYFNPAAFREFAKVGDKADSATWVKLADDTYTLLNRASNAQTGLVPDWQYFDGGAGGGGREGNYKYDACRTPWRIALDYLWNGNEKAKDWCVKISNWAYEIGPANIKDGYSLSGSPIGTVHNMCFTGGFACAALCNNQEMADAFAAEMSKIAARDNDWFTFSVGCCNMITLTGNQWRHDMESNTVPITRALKMHNNNQQWQHINRNTITVTGHSSTASVSLLNFAGQCIVKVGTSQGKTSIDISSVKSGCYLLRSENVTGATIHSVVITVY